MSCACCGCEEAACTLSEHRWRSAKRTSTLQSTTIQTKVGLSIAMAVLLMPLLPVSACHLPLVAMCCLMLVSCFISHFNQDGLGTQAWVMLIALAWTWPQSKIGGFWGYMPQASTCKKLHCRLQAFTLITPSQEDCSWGIKKERERYIYIYTHTHFLYREREQGRSC